MRKLLRNVTSNLTSPQQWLVEWFRGGPESESGVQVDINTALGLPPVWYAVSKISGHVAQLPLNVRRRLDRGSEVAESHPAQQLLNLRPNEYQTPVVFKEQMMVHALLQGNGRAAIVRRGGVAVELIPLLPSCTYTCLVDGKKWHIVQCHDDDRTMQVSISQGSSREGKFYRIPDEDVLHIPGLGYDGIAGRSLISVARDAIGLGVAGQRAASRIFKNGGRPGVILEATPGTFRGDQDRQEFMEEFNEYHEGLDNMGRAALMREGMKATTLNLSAQDAEFIAQRQFQRQDMALMFLLESILGDDASVSYNSQYEKNLAYLSNCLNKWLKKWEQESQWKLLGQRAQRTMFCKFDTAELLRSDYKTTIESCALAINSRIISPNEARERIGLNPYDDGDEFFNPAITPGTPESDDNSENDADDADEAIAIENSNRLAVVARMKHLLGVTANHARDAAGRNKNFMNWLDTYYGEKGKWNKTFARAVEEFGGSPEVASRCVCELRKNLLEVVGTVDQEGRSAAVAEIVKKWPSLAEKLADEVLLEQANA